MDECSGPNSQRNTAFSSKSKEWRVSAADVLRLNDTENQAVAEILGIRYAFAMSEAAGMPATPTTPALQDHSSRHRKSF